MDDKFKILSACDFNFDPFHRLHEHLHDYILQHVKSVKCTEVSPLWNKVLGGSKKFMKNIRLNLMDDGSENSSKKPIQSIIESERSYININFESRSALNHLEKCMMFEKFAKSLIDLKLGEICEKDAIEDLSFPLLQSLTISHENSKTSVLKILNTNQKVKKVVEDSKLAISQKYAMDVAGVLKRENKIEHLELGRYLSHFLLDNDILADNKLKLKTLKIDKFRSCTNIVKFLKTQATTLKGLTAKVIDENLLKFLVEEMNELETLEIFAIYDFDSSKIFNKTSSSIKNLKIGSFSLKSLKQLLCHLPDLKSLTLQSATNEDIKMIAVEAQNLENLFFGEIRVSAEIFYRSLKLKNVNRKIKFS